MCEEVPKTPSLLFAPPTGSPLSPHSLPKGKKKKINTTIKKKIRVQDSAGLVPPAAPHPAAERLRHAGHGAGPVPRGAGDAVGQAACGVWGGRGVSRYTGIVRRCVPLRSPPWHPQPLPLPPSTGEIPAGWSEASPVPECRGTRRRMLQAPPAPGPPPASQ